MKVEELFIGAWVITPDGKNGRIVTIDGRCLPSFQSVSIITRCERIYKVYDVDALKPIPITAEILEKNGFKEKDTIAGARKFRWVSEDTRTEITIWLDETMPMDIVKNVYFEDEVSYTLPCPWSVSQLQHALTLCGIDKEIML